MTDTILLKYGNTNTYFLRGLLIDTDMPGTMTAFRKELKKQGIPHDALRAVFVTHYHPDHMGLVGELVREGVSLVLLDRQKGFVHASDAVCRRACRDFVPIDEAAAVVIAPEESRATLATFGIAGEIVPTASHTADGAALILDDGSAFVGDLEPRAFLAGYPENEPLRADWERILAHGAKVIRYGHANAQAISDPGGNP